MPQVPPNHKTSTTNIEQYHNMPTIIKNKAEYKNILKKYYPRYSRNTNVCGGGCTCGGIVINIGNGHVTQGQFLDKAIFIKHRAWEKYATNDSFFSYE